MALPLKSILGECPIIQRAIVFRRNTLALVRRRSIARRTGNERLEELGDLGPYPTEREASSLPTPPVTPERKHRFQNSGIRFDATVRRGCSVLEQIASMQLGEHVLQAANLVSQGDLAVILKGDVGERFQTLRDKLLSHPIYDAIVSLRQVARFMEFHVFAVWDCMSLLKRLQIELTCVGTPWLPPANPRLARYINEITLGEETDEDNLGGYISHFDLYLEAMQEVGADTGKIRDLIHRLRAGVPYRLALHGISVEPEIRDFVICHLDLATDREPHRVAAAFFHGREDLIPEMFARILPRIEMDGMRLPTFTYYIRRHIELDGDSHGELSRQLLDSLTAGDPAKEREAGETACESMSLRLALWDAAYESLARLS